MERYLSTSAFARETGMTRTGVLKKIWRREIKAKKIGRDFIIDRRTLPAALSLRRNNKIRWLSIKR